ncbi:MAG: flagellar basal body L-ring protein FlgH [Burkholderiaceae bacterium]|nr:flagellar basal body L-ring protein FlgH [Rhodoferax sp.]MCB2006746.1 flagellar basal body L-ring protein FlgH [Rhodoferax sp.]MCB2029338.1 flagellar basal body L-ring protein FlgH [Rhodoferax sp.]MCB2041461.1 flagellar basal body L-ring protein FlgH [Rhodoferax sp.]MCP5263162.1 flagellar basal body L-ring protein FlgH [Rhodoferax sp.]
MPLLSLLRTSLGAALLALLASGCESLPKTERVDFAQPPSPVVVRAAEPRPVTGSLFHSTSYRPPFEDYRARLVGDVVTILITETVTASQKSTSTSSRTSSMDAGVSAFPFANATSLGKLSLNSSTNNDFAGAGATESANRFSGTITTTVVDVLPNGHLVLAGDKQIGVNQNVDVLRFSGTVDPRSIAAGGTVSSTQVANARIESRGRGAQNEAQTVGWIARFFMAMIPF